MKNSLRKATDINVESAAHTNIYKETLAFIEKPESIVLETLNARLVDAVLEQLGKDGRGNEDSTGVLAQFGVAMKGVDTPDYFHYVSLRNDRGQAHELFGDTDQKEILALSSHLFYHEREFNCGDFRPDLDPVYHGTFLMGGIRVKHMIVELKGNPGHQRYCTNM